MEARRWQVDAQSVIDRCNSSDGKEIIPVNACVGSGKTAVASHALGDFISKNRDRKTFQMFVTPRIKLCKQQADSIRCDILDMFGLEDEKDYSIVRRDCSVDGGVKFNPKKKQYAKHIILVICDESIWGTDKNDRDPEARFHSYMHGFEKMANDGYKFGNAIFDEAHNFTNCHEKIFGQEPMA